MFKKLLLFFAIATPFTCIAQPKTVQTKIQLQSVTWNDTLVFLALHKGNQLLVVDTLKLDENGKSKKSGAFIIGQYALVMPNRVQFPLIINEKKLRLKHDSATIDYGNSIENDLFSRFLIIERSIEQKRKKLRLEKLDNRMSLEMKLKSLETRRTLFLSSYSEIIKKTFAGQLVKAISLPNDLEYYYDHPESAEWLKDDFLKPVNVADPNLLYSEIFHERIRFYLTQIVEQEKDILLTELTEILEKSKQSEHNYQFLIDYWLGHFQRNKRPESEIAFTYLVNEYVLAGQTPWIEDYKKIRLEGQVQFLKNQTLGNKPPVFKLWNEKGEELDYEAARQKYQLLIFWDPDCSHCKVDVPEFFSVYQKFKNEGFSVVAIYDQLDETAWLDFIKENRLNWLNGADFKQKGNLKEDIIITETPTVLLLDKEGTIIDKRFTPNELKTFLKEKL